MPFESTRARGCLLLLVLCVLLGATGVAASGGVDPDALARQHRLSAALDGPPARLGARAVGAPTAAGPAGGGRWVASWGASPQPAAGAEPLSVRGFSRQTLREIVFSSVGGARLRVRFTNRFGRRPLVIARAAVAASAGGRALVGGTTRQLKFGGHPNATIPPGHELLSDPVTLWVRPLSRLAVSLYVPRSTGPATQHAQARETSWIASGSHILDTGGAFSRPTGQWYFLDAVDVLAPRRNLGTLAAVGDSITAGVGADVDRDDNWPDDLARRLDHYAAGGLSVIDEGIGGNRVLSAARCCGVSAVARFRSDVLAQPAIRDVILLEGVNDIGFSVRRGADSAPHTDVSAAQIVAGYRRIIAAARARHLRIFGGTLLPFEGARYWTSAGEAKREAVNRWILTSGAFDGVIDFASVMAAAGDPQRLSPSYDSGDHLHPNATGYRAMADAIDLSALLR